MATKRNGAKPEKPPLRMPKRTAVIYFNGDYTGFKATVWVNAPLELWEDLRSKVVEATPEGQQAAGLEVLNHIVLDWNFVDYDGNPIPLPAEGGLKKVPVDLVKLLDTGIGEKLQEASALPKANDEQ